MTKTWEKIFLFSTIIKHATNTCCTECSFHSYDNYSSLSASGIPRFKNSRKTMVTYLPQNSQAISFIRSNNHRSSLSRLTKDKGNLNLSCSNVRGDLYANDSFQSECDCWETPGFLSTRWYIYEYWLVSLIKITRERNYLW